MASENMEINRLEAAKAFMHAVGEAEDTVPALKELRVYLKERGLVG